MKKHITNFLLFIAGIAVALAVSEVVLRQLEVIGNAYPNSSCWYKAKWRELHQREKILLTTDVIDEYDSVYGWILKPNLDRHPTFNYQVSSNDERIRMAKSVQADSPVLHRIITIGDSFMFGECVNDEETFSAQLQQLIPNSEVYNLALHGWGHDQMLLRLRNEAQKYAPDIIILGCLNDDLARNHLLFRDYAKPYFALQGDSLVLRGVPVITPENLMQKSHFKLYEFLCSRIEPLLGSPDIMNHDALSDKILSEMISLCRELKAIPVFIYFPGLQESVEASSHPSQVFVDVCKKHGALWIDPTPSLHTFLNSESRPEKHFECHYSPDLIKVMTSEVASALPLNSDK